MCGRYTFELNQVKEIDRIYELAQKNGYRPDISVVTPGTSPATVISKSNQIEVVTTKWGFPGFKPNQLIINARSETVLEKKMFASAFQKNRCVFPTTGFFEWSAEHQKYWFNYSSNPQALYIAGFYDYFDQTPQSIILTTAPNSSVSEIHDRMPLILQKNQIKPWLTDLDYAKNLLQNPMPELFKTIQ
ncbi:SOS response-associated peptidase family protein [Xylocopilactobacillus apis]|uniref:Abasic site processing protein n=1 Tax=Xylocopilactobacillus apis TaxID=2932183 RepID=A0AAU9CZ87_9LACO|nr:SOS response-associated peptidase family protein [Xylocopilactobacillus apis]BDR55541.1 DUF159 family protein [Xylocopilactobacillus apis]